MKMREKPLGLQLISLALILNIAYLTSVWFSPNMLALVEQGNIPYFAKIWLVYFLELCAVGISSKFALAALFAWHIFTLFGLWRMRPWSHRSLVYILVIMIIWGAIFPQIATEAFDAMRFVEGNGFSISAVSQAGIEAANWLGQVIFLLWGLLFALWFVVVPACALYYVTEPRVRVYFGIPIFKDIKKFKRVSFILYLGLIILSAVIILPFVFALFSQVTR